MSETSEITIFMAISVDGYIAGPNSETPWSDEGWDNYKKYISLSDCLIIGRKTYDIMLEDDDFGAIGNPNIIVVTKDPLKNVPSATTPEESLALAKQKGWSKIIIGGGKILNSSFLNKKLAHILHLDIEPVILRDGLKLFDTADKMTNLSLLHSETLESGTISTHYKIEN